MPWCHVPSFIKKCLHSSENIEALLIMKSFQWAKIFKSRFIAFCTGGGFWIIINCFKPLLRGLDDVRLPYFIWNPLQRFPYFFLNQSEIIYAEARCSNGSLAFSCFTDCYFYGKIYGIWAISCNGPIYIPYI